MRGQQCENEPPSCTSLLSRVYPCSGCSSALTVHTSPTTPSAGQLFLSLETQVGIPSHWKHLLSLPSPAAALLSCFHPCQLLQAPELLERLPHLILEGLGHGRFSNCFLEEPKLRACFFRRGSQDRLSNGCHMTQGSPGVSPSFHWHFTTCSLDKSPNLVS